MDLYYFANIFIRICISKQGCTSIGTNLCTNGLVLIRVLVCIQATLLVRTDISTCCSDVDTNLRILISIYSGTGRLLLISDFCIPNSELRVPMSDVQISEGLDLQMFGVWCLDF